MTVADAPAYVLTNPGVGKINQSTYSLPAVLQYSLYEMLL